MPSIGLGIGIGMGGGAGSSVFIPTPDGFDWYNYPVPEGLEWDYALFPLVVRRTGGRFAVVGNPRDYVDPDIWTGPVIHVDVATGDDGNTGLAEVEGDFSDAKKTIQAAFLAGNALAEPYRVLVMTGEYRESQFTANGTVEPDQPVALLNYGGPVKYRTGPWETTWTLHAGTTYTATISSLNRVFRTDVLTADGHYTEMPMAAELVSNEAPLDTWVKDGSAVYVNIGSAPGVRDIAPIRSFHGASFKNHTHDFYIEGFNIEGGIGGALELTATATRNIIAVGCTFKYSSPSVSTAQLDAVRVTGTNGFFWARDCDGSRGAKDGWNFHPGSNPQLYALLERCTGSHNGWNGASSVNAVTSHGDVIMAIVDGDFGDSSEYAVGGTVLHCIEDTRTWAIGAAFTARDNNGTGETRAIKISNDSFAWFQYTYADAAGGASLNYAIEANGGTVYKRQHINYAGTEETSGGGSIQTF